MIRGGALATAQDVAGFKQMAKLWLMRDELQTFIDTTIAHSKAVVTTAHRAMRPELIDDYFGQPDFKGMQALANKLKALEEK